MPERVLSELFFVQNFFPNIIGISWTLAIEEHFYFLLVFLILICIKKGLLENKKVIIGTCLAILCTCFVLRLYLNLNHPFNDWTHFYPTYLRIDSLVFGVMISWFYHFRNTGYAAFLARQRILLLLAMVAGLSLPLFFPYNHFVMNTIGLSLLYMAFGAIICIGEGSEAFHSRWLKPFVYVGRYSYSIYLVHLLCGPAVANTFRTYIFTSPGLEWINDTINFLANIGIGIVLSLLIEQPFLKIRDKYFPKPGEKASKQDKASKVELAVR
jgi:peptidoglycan/LPS O-acetylase OafA/YrhL